MSPRRLTLNPATGRKLLVTGYSNAGKREDMGHWGSRMPSSDPAMCFSISWECMRVSMPGVAWLQDADLDKRLELICRVNFRGWLQVRNISISDTGTRAGPSTWW